MDEKKDDVKEEGVIPSEESPENNAPEDKEVVENTGKEVLEEKEEKPRPTADELLQGKKSERRVDEKRFNALLEQAKLAELYGPIIEKLKDKPDEIERLLGKEEKNPFSQDELSERIHALEEERKSEKRKEMRDAVNDALTRWESFPKDWEDIQGQVTVLMRQGLSAREAIRRSYLALHPEDAAEEMKRVAVENANISGMHRTPAGSGAPSILDQQEGPKLTEAEQKVAQTLIGKTIGGKVLFKTAEDYARALERNKSRMGSGFSTLF